MALAPPVRWFHGGIPGLAEGDLILPPSASGFPTIMKEAGEDPAFVFISSELHIATGYAALWTVNPFTVGNGAVYRVEPDRPGLQRKPGRQRRGHEATCLQATVLEVITPGITRARALALEGGLGAEVAEQESIWRLLPSFAAPDLRAASARPVIVRR